MIIKGSHTKQNTRVTKRPAFCSVKIVKPSGETIEAKARYKAVQGQRSVLETVFGFPAQHRIKAKRRTLPVLETVSI